MISIMIILGTEMSGSHGVPAPAHTQPPYMGSARPPHTAAPGTQPPDSYGPSTTISTVNGQHYTTSAQPDGTHVITHSGEFTEVHINTNPAHAGTPAPFPNPSYPNTWYTQSADTTSVFPKDYENGYFPASNVVKSEEGDAPSPHHPSGQRDLCELTNVNMDTLHYRQYTQGEVYITGEKKGDGTGTLLIPKEEPQSGDTGAMVSQPVPVYDTTVEIIPETAAEAEKLVSKIEEETKAVMESQGIEIKEEDDVGLEAKVEPMPVQPGQPIGTAVAIQSIEVKDEVKTEVAEVTVEKPEVTISSGERKAPSNPGQPGQPEDSEYMLYMFQGSHHQGKSGKNFPSGNSGNFMIFC